MSSDLFTLFKNSYNHGNSYLISAPTGSGKTHIAKYLLNEEERIVVYVSPLKALSREVYKAIKRNAKYIDSDVYEDDLRYFNSDALLTTYEKFDSAIRHNYPWLKEISLVIIDEIHNVESDRGLPIEDIVLWAKHNSVPIIGLSATIGDLENYRKWLNAELIKIEKRKVPLHECVAFPFLIRCYDDNRIISIEKRGLKNVKLDLLLGVLNYILALNKNALVFVRSRNSAETLAETLRKFSIPALPYHSGLPFEIRDKTVEQFIKGEIKVLVSTTALGQGVNLPVYATVFYDITLPDSNEKGEFKGWRELTPAEFKQIAGRAGRPGFDKEGMAIVITDTIKEMDKVVKKYYKSEVKEEIGGIEYTLENLTLGVISWLNKAKEEEIENTIKEGSLHFKGKEVKPSIDYLHSLGLITFENNGNIILTPLGKAVSLSYIDVMALKGFPVNTDDFDFLDVLVSSPEVAQSLRGCEEGKELLKRWINGEDISTLCLKLSAKDIEEVISNARWISFALYRVLKALGHKKAKEALEFYESVKYGLPKFGVTLVKLGIDKDKAKIIIQKGIKSLEELCVVSNLLKLGEFNFCKRYQIELREFVNENYGKSIYKDDPRVEALKQIGIITEDYKWKEYK
ncbi:helicase-related protein [Sulfurisphaera javensis]|uniref:Helicase-related protein n=1 Tax=Sulfurisphaera javensis TaxID=2049879 RepID=A0AAT9GQS8_9CREN